MKRLFLFLGITIFATGITYALKVSAQERQAKKLYHVSLSLEDWQKQFNYLEYVKGQLKQTDLPAKQVSFINDSLLTNLQNTIASQLQSQLAAEQKKDSIKTKK